MLKCLIALILFSANLLAAQNGELVIVYTNNTNGILENCRCPERAYGALEKRAAFIDSVRKVHPDLLLLDSGDLLDIRPNALLHRYIIKAYGLMRYDAWTPGDQDFIEGIDFFRNQLLAMPGALVSSNLSISGKPIGSRWIRKVIAGLSVGITGLSDPQCFRYLPDSTAEDLSIESPEEALEITLAAFTGECDLTILLSHAGFERDNVIAARFPEIDLIVGGHSQTILEQPEIVGKTMIVQAGEGGNRVGLLTIRVVNGQISSYHNTLHLLRKEDRDAPEMLSLIEEYHKKRIMRIQHDRTKPRDL